MEIFLKDKVQNLDKRLNIITMSNQVQIYYEPTGLRINDQVQLYVYWLSPKKALGFKSYKELQLFCSLKQFELWNNLNDLHEIITTKTDYKQIIKSIVLKDIISLSSYLEIKRSDAFEIIKSLQPEFMANESDFFVC